MVISTQEGGLGTRARHKASGPFRISKSNGMPQVSVHVCEVSRPQGGVA